MIPIYRFRLALIVLQVWGLLKRPQFLQQLLLRAGLLLGGAGLPYGILAQVVDVDGNSYRTIKIGRQTWMAENLKVKHFRNGDPIPYLKSLDAWTLSGERKRPGMCFYNHDSIIGTKFGLLYNWYAASDSRNIAPEGWRVPTSADWDALHAYIDSAFYKYLHWDRLDQELYKFMAKAEKAPADQLLGLKQVTGGMLSQLGAGIVKYNDSLYARKIPEVYGFYYRSPLSPVVIMLHRFGCGAYLKSNTPADWIMIREESSIKPEVNEVSGAGHNFSGFTGLPAGRRWSVNFTDLNVTGSWWSSSLNGNQAALHTRVEASMFQALWNMEEAKTTGLSIRCIKEE